MRYLFLRTLRLTSDAQFKQVFNKAKRITTRLGTVLCCCNDVGHPRLGVIVPKKNIKLASRRNHFKRIIRESFRLRQHQLAAIDIVFLVNKETANTIKRDLWDYLEKLWDELVPLVNKA